MVQRFLFRSGRPLALALGLGVALGLAGCNAPQMTASANLAALKPENATLAVLGVSGPSDEQGQRFAAIFAQEARTRGFVLADAHAPVATTRLRAYLDSFTGTDGKPAISYVLQTSADGRTRANRVSGLVPANAPGWPGLDDATMRRVAASGLDELTRLLTGQSIATGDVAAGDVAAAGEDSL
ncbi:MAG: hypothetical protein CTY25_10830 [Methylobacterium sp.]|nr:MAG: hypothetical protein CTY25_10830 [Methylobacterium sp.]